MRGFLYCLIYTLVVGWALFFLGRLIPRGAFNAEKFPFKTHAFEKKLYDFLRVKRWQKSLPDMSRLFFKIMAKKQASMDMDFSLMLHETCVAEAVHLIQCGLGFVCLALWRGAGGIIVSVGYFLGNMAFVVVQRYNRPRFLSLERRASQHAYISGGCGEESAEGALEAK